MLKKKNCEIKSSVIGNLDLRERRRLNTRTTTTIITTTMMITTTAPAAIPAIRGTDRGSPRHNTP